MLKEFTKDRYDVLFRVSKSSKMQSLILNNLYEEDCIDLT